MIVATIVVNWNRRDDTLACLASLSGQAADGVDQHIIVVDNGSTDGSVAAIDATFPYVETLPLEANLGYARAVNTGLRHALASAAELTWLVNNDTVARPGLLAALVGAMAEPSVGLAAPTVYFLDAPTRVWPSAGRRRRLTLAAFDTTADPPSRRPYDVDWATGCCLMVRTEVWRGTGMLDPRYAFYYEDHDLCLRARSAGWRIVHVPDATVLHRVAASTGEGSPRQLYLLARSSVPYYWLHTRGMHRAFIVAYRLGSFARTALECMASGRPRSAAAYARGLRDGLADLVGTPAGRRRRDPFE